MPKRLTDYTKNGIIAINGNIGHIDFDICLSMPILNTCNNTMPLSSNFQFCLPQNGDCYGFWQATFYFFGYNLFKRKSLCSQSTSNRLESCLLWSNMCEPRASCALVLTCGIGFGCPFIFPHFILLPNETAFTTIISCIVPIHNITRFGRQKNHKHTHTESKRRWFCIHFTLHNFSLKPLHTCRKPFLSSFFMHICLRYTIVCVCICMLLSNKICLHNTCITFTTR